MECLLYAPSRVSAAEKRRIKKIVELFFKKMEKTGQASVHLVGERTMKRLNNRFRQKNKVTDVLAFAAQEGKRLPAEAEDWGDIFICLPQIKKQAAVFGVTVENELERMLAHGLLHLWGHDHERPRQARRMFALQEKLVADCLIRPGMIKLS